MDEPVVEVVEPQVVDNIEKPPEKLENPAPKKNGRPAGSKDKVKRVVKPRKITIVEEPLHVETVHELAVPDPVVPKPLPKPRVTVAPEPEIRYVDRYIEYSPRSSMRIAHGHFANEQQTRHDARREHFAHLCTSRLR